nr:hypothetical protein CFP56_03981 [Quercus suber]
MPSPTVRYVRARHSLSGQSTMISDDALEQFHLLRPDGPAFSIIDVRSERESDPNTIDLRWNSAEEDRRWLMKLLGISVWKDTFTKQEVGATAQELPKLSVARCMGQDWTSREKAEQWEN